MQEEAGQHAVRQLDAEVERLVAKVEALRTELARAEEELRQRRAEDMEARRTVVSGETSSEQKT